MGAPDPLKPVILFDGICNLCNATVRFIIKRDREARFRFAPLQSDAAKQLLQGHKISTSSFESIVLIKNGKVYQRSSAALEIARGLDGMWKVFYVFRIVPRPVCDLIYDWIAKNRYRFFGHRDECMIPSENIRTRFLG